MDLWRAKYLLEAQAYRDVIEGMIEEYKKRYTAETPFIARKCVEQALSEYLGPQCKDCGGSKELMIDQQLKLCPTCDGSGLRRYTDDQRAGRMKIERRNVERRAGKMRWIAEQLGEMDRQVNVVMNMELERLRLR